MIEVHRLLEFVIFTNNFRDVERAIYIPEKKRQENDAEHSYQLALVAWYLIETEKYPFDLTKVIRYALIHDLVETYAGDEQAHGRTEKAAKKKREREQKALERIRSEFPHFPEIAEWIHGYEIREDPESIFVYALDKLLPMLNLYLDGGHTWKKLHISLKDVAELKERTLKDSPEIYRIWKSLEKLLQKEERRLFGNS